MLAATDPELGTTNTENDTGMKKDVVERKCHKLASVHDFLEMLPGSQILRATQKKPHAQNKEITAVGYISDTYEIVKASWSLFQHDGAAVFKWSERSPLPPAMSAKDLPAGRTQIVNVRHIRRINRDPVQSDVDSAPGSISDTEDWLNWNGELDSPNDRQDDCATDVESDIEQLNHIGDLEYTEQWDVSTAPNVPRLIWPTQKSKRQGEKELGTVNAIETRRINELNIK
jgi:hypothetical protein